MPTKNLEAQFVTKPAIKNCGPALRLVVEREVTQGYGQRDKFPILQPGDLLEGISDGSLFNIRRAWHHGERWPEPVGLCIPETALLPLSEDVPERLVKTRSLAVGNLFVFGRILYQVVEPVDGNPQARLWGNVDGPMVALDPASPLAARRPVVAEGEPIPSYMEKRDLFNEQGLPARFRFPTQSMAFKALCLDHALTQPVGVIARIYGPMAYVLADEVGNYRYYYYYFKDQGKPSTGLTAPLAQSGVFGSNYNYTDGPGHWQFVL